MGEEQLPASALSEIHKRADASMIRRQQQFIRRLQPLREDDNVQRINQMFKVHNMDCLTDLKEQYDMMGKLLDSQPQNDVERLKIEQEYFKWYWDSFKTEQDIKSILKRRQVESDVNKQQETHKDEVTEAYENKELKDLLKETAEMNAVISAGQYNLHKKDVTDRMHSLAFKM